MFVAQGSCQVGLEIELAIFASFFWSEHVRPWDFVFGKHVGLKYRRYIIKLSSESLDETEGSGDEKLGVNISLNTQVMKNPSCRCSEKGIHHPLRQSGLEYNGPSGITRNMNCW